jgi:hypothetical protein
MGDFSFYDDVEALERYIGVPKGALSNIPIYARVPAVDAILSVRKMEEKSLFRPGLYYIVLADLVGNTDFNAKYGDRAGDVRVEWFQTAAITALGQITPSNYAAYIKPIGDAALLIFSSFADVARWSERFTDEMISISQEYAELADSNDDDFEQQLEDFELRARRLVHLGEIRFKEATDPICLSVSQTFKIEKMFKELDLGCTEAVLAAVGPLLPDLGLIAHDNALVRLAGDTQDSKTYYLKRK